MKRKLPSIDIAQSVMQRIERDGVRMHSERSLRVQKYAQRFLIVILALISGLGVLSLAYVLRNDVFIGYTTLISESDFLRSLPWQGLLTTVGSSVALFVLVLKLRDQHGSLRLGYVVAGWLLAVGVLAGIAGQLPSSSTPSILARTAYWSDKDPSQLEGVIVEIVDGQTAKVKVGDKVIIIHTDTSELKVGDKVLVVGDKKTDDLYVKGIQVTKQAPQKTTETKQEKPPKAIEPPKRIEPKEEKEITAPTPTPEVKPTPTPEPAAITPGIKIISKTQNATDVIITYSIAPSMAGKCKTMLKNDPLTAYSEYDWHSSATSTCTNTIPKSSLTAGTWSGIAYWKFPYNEWSNYYEITFTIDVTIP